MLLREHGSISNIVSQVAFICQVNPPVMDLRAVNGSSVVPVVMIGQSLLLEITMEVPINSESLYTLDINMPMIDNNPQFRVCKVYFRVSNPNLLYSYRVRM